MGGDALPQQVHKVSWGLLPTPNMHNTLRTSTLVQAHILVHAHQHTTHQNERGSRGESKCDGESKKKSGTKQNKNKTKKERTKQRKKGSV